MFEMVMLSGKGGTGKTSLAAAFAHLSSDHVICDLDVDAPDLHLLLRPQKTTSEKFYSGHAAKIVIEKCDACRQCVEMCRFGAVSMATSFAQIDPLKCEGCKVCVEFCPHGAINFPIKQCGEWYLSDTRFGWMVHAHLFPAEDNSGKLVALLREKAKEVAKQNQLSMILSDGPPGIGCPVISSLSGASFAAIVTEPTPSGRHDLERVVDLCRHFNIPTGVIINKSDLNQRMTNQIKHYSTENSITILGSLPHDPVVTQAMVTGKTITEYQSNGFADQVRQIWQHIEEIAASGIAA